MSGETELCRATHGFHPVLVINDNLIAIARVEDDGIIALDPGSGSGFCQPAAGGLFSDSVRSKRKHGKMEKGLH